MNNITIFCEGISDQIFISDCLELFYNIKKLNKSKIKDSVDLLLENNNMIRNINGCSNLSNDINIQKMIESVELGGKNIVIFDADYKKHNITSQSTGNKGYNSCKFKLEELKKNSNVQFDYYILPNNSDDGLFENLLRKLIPPSMEPIFECIQSHQHCLGNLNFANVQIADLKQQINFYLYTLNQNTINRDYKNSDYWNLNFEEILELKKFKDFLNLNFEN